MTGRPADGYFFSTHLNAVEKGLAGTEHWIAFGLVFIGIIAYFIWRRRATKAGSD